MKRLECLNFLEKCFQFLNVQTKTRKKLVFCLFLATLSFWMLMAGTWIVYFCFTADFVTENFGGHMIVTDQALTTDTLLATNS